ncbi:MAG TPA: LysR family transcriptional regulator [Xanthobacteraceae bacterium]|nr:LysR family transcriptional regulator [Xanthobacteraceae bacterium]
MDLRQVRTFVTVAELGTVSKAALRLHVAQPALSRQIGDLERELGLKLFDRIGRRLILTGAGEQLLSDCRGLLNYAGGLAERAQLLRRGDTGVLKVAASPQHIESVLAGFLHQYAERYPNVQVKLIEAGGIETLAMLERGEIHLGQNLLRAVQAESARFGSCVLESVELLAASHPSLKLASRRTIEIGRLAPYPLLLLNPEFVVRRTFDAACRLAGLQPKIMLESRAPHTLLALAEAGHGVAIIPSQLQAHRYELQITGIVYQGKSLSEPLCLLWDKRRPLPAYATDFCTMLSDYMRKIFPITQPSKFETRGTSRRSAGRHLRRVGAD